jgi:hypothetical protein
VLQKFFKNHVFAVLETFGKINLGVRKNVFMTRGIAIFFKMQCFEVLETFGKINLGVRKNIFMTRGVAKVF